MGTRGAYGFRVEGVDKITYNQFDSYPEGLGLNMMEAIFEFDDEALLRAAVLTRLVAEHENPPPEDCERYGETADWYVLLRPFQGRLGAIVGGECSHMIDNHEFLADSLFCEWAYVINMDAKALEVYKGFNKSADAPGRYSAMTYDGYHGVALVAEIPFDSIRRLGAKEALGLISQGEDRE